MWLAFVLHLLEIAAVIVSIILVLLIAKHLATTNDKLVVECCLGCGRTYSWIRGFGRIFVYCMISVIVPKTRRGIMD
jgi:hypothetical protein